MSIYQDIILDHYRNPRNKRSLQNPTASSDLRNPLCGDVIHVDVAVRDGVITDVAFEGSGCAISQASASMMTEYAKGKSNEALKKIDKDFIVGMLGLELSPTRLKCALLAWEALARSLP